MAGRGRLSRCWMTSRPLALLSPRPPASPPWPLLRQTPSLAAATACRTPSLAVESPCPARGLPSQPLRSGKLRCELCSLGPISGSLSFRSNYRKPQFEVQVQEASVLDPNSGSLSLRSIYRKPQFEVQVQEASVLGPYSGSLSLRSNYRKPQFEVQVQEASVLGPNSGSLSLRTINREPPF